MKRTAEMDGLVLFNQAESGDRIAMGRLLSMAENRAKETLELIQKKGVISHNCCVMGITGSPGAGKSTLIGSLLSVWNEERKKVAVLAVDPSSPFQAGRFWGIGFGC